MINFLFVAWNGNSVIDHPNKLQARVCTTTLYAKKKNTVMTIYFIYSAIQ